MLKPFLIIILIVILIIAILGIFYIVGSLNTNKKPLTSQNPNNTFQIQGMKVEILKQGSGDGAKNGDKVTVNYVGMLENGKKFDSSYDRNSPFTFVLGANRVIKGWDAGVEEMKVGEKRKLVIPPELGYGAAGFPGIIPQNATLTFEIELLKISK